MDPTQVFYDMIEAAETGDVDESHVLAESLTSWLDRGGSMPRTPIGVMPRTPIGVQTLPQRLVRHTIRLVLANAYAAGGSVMQTYRVKTHETHVQSVLVWAESAEAAIEKVSNGEGENNGPIEFVERQDSTEWHAEPVESEVA